MTRFLAFVFCSYSSCVSAFSHSATRVNGNSFHNVQLAKSKIPPVAKRISLKTKSQVSALPSGFLTSSAATKATAVLSGISSPVVSVSTLAFVVLVHEAGHFLAARSMNIDVEEFSVGVGPKLAGFTTNKKKDDAEQQSNMNGKKSSNVVSLESSSHDAKPIDFSLRAIPLGGYVRFPDNYNRTEAMINEQKARKAEEQTPEEKDEKKFQPLAAISNVFRSKKEIEEEKQREKELRLEEERKKKQWWRAFMVKNTKKKKEKQSKKITSPEIVYFDNPNLLQNRPWSQRAIVLVGGIVFNLILAFSVYFGEVTVGKGLPKPMFEPGAIVRVVNSNTETANSASYGILNAGDKIIGINGNPMILERATSTALAQEGINNFISTIRATTPGDSVTLSVIPKKSNEVKEVTIAPRAPIDPKTGQALSPLSIGVSLTPNYIETKLIRANSIPEAFQLAGTALTDITTDTASTIGKALYSMAFSSSSPSSELNGPIGVIRMGSSVASESNFDIGAIAAFAAAISVNLAVVNALPLPALDGGQLVFVLLEGLVGRKVVDQKLEETINAYCLILILLLSFSTTIGDIGNIIIGR